MFYSSRYLNFYDGKLYFIHTPFNLIDLVSGMTASSGHAWSRSYEPARSLISAVQNTFGPAIISRFDYVNDEIGRRVSRADSGEAFQNPAFDVYFYNTRSEVIGAQRYHGTGISDTSRPFGGCGFGYAYDPIGNRLSASETVGGEMLTKTYTANALNQYTSIANPDAVGLRGSATNSATVTMNGNAVERANIVAPWTPWHHALPTDNADGGAFTFAEIMAVVNPPGEILGSVPYFSPGRSPAGERPGGRKTKRPRRIAPAGPLARRHH